MQIQVNTDHSLEGNEARDLWTRGVVEAALSHVTGHVTRVEVHLSDENGAKGGGDKRCLMEARLTGRPPLAVTNHADSLDAAVHGAAGKLVRAIDHSLGRADKHAHDARVVPEVDAVEPLPAASRD
jgi:hypothetical protein